MLFPTSCPVCGRRGPAPCEQCIGLLRPAPSLPPPPGLDGCTALLAYDDVGRELLARLKYRNARSVVPWLVWQLAGRVHAGSVDALCWAPTSAARRRRRGFDQARLLAGAVAREAGLPFVDLLVRRAGPPQTGLAVADRWSSPVFDVRRHRPVPPRVLIVDDVVTTGATLAAAARTLRGAGAREVWGLAAGRTPLKPRERTSDAGRDGEQRSA